MKKISKKEIKATREEFLEMLTELGITSINIESIERQYRINGVLIICKAFAGTEISKRFDESLFAESFRNEIKIGYDSNSNFNTSVLLEVIPSHIQIFYKRKKVNKDTEIDVEENSDY